MPSPGFSARRAHPGSSARRARPGWRREEAVVKPAVCGLQPVPPGARPRLSGRERRRAVRTVVAAGDVLVQPLVRHMRGCRRVVAESALAERQVTPCSNGPHRGDWRVQGEFGGTAEIRPAPARLIEGARRGLAAAGAKAHSRVYRVSGSGSAGADGARADRAAVISRSRAAGGRPICARDRDGPSSNSGRAGVLWMAAVA